MLHVLRAYWFHIYFYALILHRKFALPMFYCSRKEYWAELSIDWMQATYVALVLYVFCRNGGLNDQFKIEKFNIKIEYSKNQLKIKIMKIKIKM